jgi:hypothetical protein
LVVLLFLHNRVFWLPNPLPNREEGEPNRTFKSGTVPGQDEYGKGHHRLAQPATALSRTAQTSTVAELARFFPEATPLRIPVQFTRCMSPSRIDTSHINTAPIDSSNNSQPGGQGVPENTVIEFGTSREVLFACTTPLEFADILRLRNSDGSLDTEASVVAVQYHPSKTIVAARFVAAVPNWIVKP